MKLGLKIANWSMSVVRSAVCATVTLASNAPNEIARANTWASGRNIRVRLPSCNASPNAILTAADSA